MTIQIPSWKAGVGFRTRRPYAKRKSQAKSRFRKSSCQLAVDTVEDDHLLANITEFTPSRYERTMSKFFPSDYVPHPRKGMSGTEYRGQQHRQGGESNNKTQEWSKPVANYQST